MRTMGAHSDGCQHVVENEQSWLIGICVCSPQVQVVNDVHVTRRRLRCIQRVLQVSNCRHCHKHIACRGRGVHSQQQ